MHNSNPSNSQNFNRFSYVLNNPLKYVDPSGYVALNPRYEYQAGPKTKFYTWMPEFYEEYLDNQGRNWKYYGETINTPGFYGDETGMWISKLNEHNELIYNYNELRQIVQNNANSNSFFSSFSMGAGTFRVEGKESHNLQLRYEIIPSSTSEFDGFGGKLKYCFNGGNINGWKYDISGKFEGAAPIGGIAPVPSFSGLKIKNIWNLAKALKASVKKGQAPKEVLRVDIPKLNEVGKPIFNQKPHVHINNRAFNLDGTWKHGDGDISSSVLKWIQKYL